MSDKLRLAAAIEALVPGGPGISFDITIPSSRTPTTAAGRALWGHMRNWFDDPSPDLICDIEDQAREDPCPHCIMEHVWPCPTIPRCDEPGCDNEASCGWPSPTGYRRTCGDHYRAALEEPTP